MVGQRKNNLVAILFFATCLFLVDSFDKAVASENVTLKIVNEGVVPTLEVRTPLWSVVGSRRKEGLRVLNDIFQRQLQEMVRSGKIPHFLDPIELAGDTFHQQAEETLEKVEQLVSVLTGQSGSGDLEKIAELQKPVENESHHSSWFRDFLGPQMVPKGLLFMLSIKLGEQRISALPMMAGGRLKIGFVVMLWSVQRYPLSLNLDAKEAQLLEKLKGLPETSLDTLDPDQSAVLAGLQKRIGTPTYQWSWENRANVWIGANVRFEINTANQGGAERSLRFGIGPFWGNLTELREFRGHFVDGLVEFNLFGSNDYKFDLWLGSNFLSKSGNFLGDIRFLLVGLKTPMRNVKLIQTRTIEAPQSANRSNIAAWLNAYEVFDQDTFQGLFKGLWNHNKINLNQGGSVDEEGIYRRKAHSK